MSDFIKVFEPDTPEYNRLEEAAALMTDKSPNHWRYHVGRTYFDLGQDWSWTTIICEGGELGSYQALYPVDQERILMAATPDELAAAVDAVFTNKFCSDHVARYIVTYSPDDGAGNPSHLSTYWAVMARNEADAQRLFRRRFPATHHVIKIQLADEKNRFAYGGGWLTDSEREAGKAKLSVIMDAERAARAEAEQTVRTWELEEFEAYVAWRERRASENSQNLEGVHVGDMFYVMWGYEQTNYDFFQVVGLRGKHTVVLRQLRTRSAAFGNMLSLDRPIRNAFADDTRYTLRTVADSRGTQGFRINAPEGFGTGHVLRRCEDGRVFECSHYA